MFKKLFKYDFRSLSRIALPLVLATVGAGLVGMLCAFLLFVADLTDLPNVLSIFLAIFSMLGFFGAILLIVVSIVVIHVLIYMDFYRSLLTDEGYLTFTLPVTAKDIIHSKLVNAMLWVTLSALATLCAVLLIFIPFSTGMGFLEVLEIFFGEIETVLGESVLAMILAFLSFAASAVNTVLLYFTAIFFGGVVAQKRKVLCAVLSVLVVNFIQSTVVNIISAIIMAVAYGMAYAGGNELVDGSFMSTVNLLIVTGMNIAFYFLLKHFMEKKINLS